MHQLRKQLLCIKIPYQYYLDNDIPVVLSTDGHGIYDTTIRNEDAIAKRIISEDEYSQIIATDDELFKRKKAK